MKYCLILFLSLFGMNAFCQNLGLYIVPDSIKATGFYAEVKISESKGRDRIAANSASMHISYNNGQKIVKFRIFQNENPRDVVGKDVYPHERGMSRAWNYDWKYNETYPLLILVASDSAKRKALYSGYIFLPDEKKWKLISTLSYGDTVSIRSTSGSRKGSSSNHWLLRSNGTWKALDSQATKPPVLRHMSNIDSLYQQKLEEDMLRSKLPKDSVNYEDGVFYQSLKEGTGRLVKVTDTLTVHYKGSLYSDGSIFDQTKEKPATFPLERLIKGWQLGLAHCRVGGKMRLFITSGSAYGIRTRSATIPPNSILVFDIEVLDAKEKIVK